MQFPAISIRLRNSGVSHQFPTMYYTEEGAHGCEKWFEVFPLEFKDKDMTRKMFKLSFVMPKLI